MINVIQGNIFNVQPAEDELHYICHGCNDIGGFGMGVAGQISNRWPYVREEYFKWYRSGVKFGLGEIDVVPLIPANTRISVVNMITQKGIGETRLDNTIIPPIRWDSTYECFMRLRHRIVEANKLDKWKRVINLVTIGTGLAGGSHADFCQTVWKAFNPSVYEGQVNVYAYTDDDYKKVKTLEVMQTI